VLSIVREGYAEFGPTLAAEKLYERHDITKNFSVIKQAQFYSLLIAIRMCIKSVKMLAQTIFL